LVRVSARELVVDKATVAVAPEPPPPENCTVGTLEYPPPALARVIEAIEPVAANVEVAVAWVPPAGGAERVTVGALVYPLPEEVIVNPVTTPAVIVAVALAWVPPAGGAERVTVGAVV
jgi:hypothetical protein